MPIFDKRSDLAEGLLLDSRSLGALLPEAGEDAEVVEVLAKEGFSDAFLGGLEEEEGVGLVCQLSLDLHSQWHALMDWARSQRV